MKNFFLRLLLLLTISSILAGCEGVVSPAGGIATITVTPSQASIEVNQTQQFTAQAKDSSGTLVPGVTFTWSSSKTAVASVNVSGLAIGIAAGTTNITASSGGVTSNAATLTVTGGGTTDVTLTLTVLGSGTVTSSPAGITCPTTCTAFFPSATVVTLTATSASGYVFNGWGGVCSGTATTCIVTMNADKSATANFVKAPVQTFPLSVSVAGSGSVSSTPAGITCGTDCTEAYASGTVVTLTAAASTGYIFNGWGTDCSSAGTFPTCSLTMNANKSVTATFGQNLPSTPASLVAKAGDAQVTLTWSANPAAENVTSYTLYMATTSWTTWSSTLPGAMQHTLLPCCTYTHTGLANGTTYYFVVTATNAGGESAESAQVQATPAAAGVGGAASFSPATSFSVGTGPISIVIGDLNADGKPDLAVANSGSNTVSVFLGTGTGPFGSATNFSVGMTPYSVAIGDLNADGKPDLAVANKDSSNVSVLLGTGTGSFGSATNFSVGTSPWSVAIGDLNADGKPDLAVANQISSDVSVLLGTGTGSFGSVTNFDVGTQPLSVAIGDLNSDGKPDLAVANAGSNNVSVLLGTGTGSFGAATNFSVGVGPISVAIGDLNSDGKPDLAVANEASGKVSILLGTGTGSFGPATNFVAVTHPHSVAIGDLNGNGKPDLAVANASSSNVSILLGDATGSFGAATNFSVGTGPHSVAIGDLNSDGKPDLAVANRDSDNVSILLNTTQGLWVKLNSLTSPVSPGDIATMTVETTANAECSITVVYKSGPSQAQGLEPKTADSQGRVSWAWLVGTQTTPGTWPITVTCSAGGQEGTLQTSFAQKFGVTQKFGVRSCNITLLPCAGADGAGRIGL